MEKPRHFDTIGDKYVCKRFLRVNKVSGGQFRIQEYYLARNEEGMLGFLGLGIQSLLNYITKQSTYAFNPIKEELIWCEFHHAYILPEEKEHFIFPIIIGEVYSLKGGVKTIYWENEVIEPIKHPKQKA